jgi:hypothetical protein
LISKVEDGMSTPGTKVSYGGDAHVDVGPLDAFGTRTVEILELTRFRGHLRMRRGVHDGKEEEDVSGRVSRADGAPGAVGANG